MNPLRCVVVDDEQGAIDVLSSYISKTQKLSLLTSFRDPVAALEYLQVEQVDVLFVDINMPDLSGLKLARLISGRGVQVIFCTAYAEHAVESYEIPATDYLLKPVPFDRFLAAVAKLVPETAASDDPAEEQPRLFIKSGSRIHPVDTAEIHYLEKDGHYIVFHLGSKQLLSRMSIAEALDMLPAEGFLQVHRSFIVALEHLDLIQNQFVTIGKREIPIGDRYREAFFQRVSISGK